MPAPLPRSLLDNPELGRWISLEEPGVVTVSSGKVELGQGILTALAQIAAEALGLDLARIALRPADTARSPNEGYTAGSLSVEVSGAAIGLAAAQARDALLQAAARRLGADGLDSDADGAILRGGQPTGLDLWAVAAEVDWGQPVQADVPRHPGDAPRLVGLSTPRIDMAPKLGGGGFIHDMVLSALRHARVVRQPIRLAHLAHFDEDRLRRRHPGVEALREADFLALLADDEGAVEAAHRDAEALATWEEVPGLWRAAVVGEPRLDRLGREPSGPQGNHALSAEYRRGMVAHASIGLSCALAVAADDGLTVWTHSQGIFPLRDQIAACLGLDAGTVRVIHAHGAGCYGHNGADDAALDAAIVATRRPGRPVRVQWSREDELSRAPLGAAMSARIEAALDAQGRVDRWSMEVLSAPHAQRPGAGGQANLTSAEALDPARIPARVSDLPPDAGGGASRNAVAFYDLSWQQVRVDLDPRAAIRTSSLRSLGAHLNVFAIESAMDELAALAGEDPLAFRLAHLSDPRARRVLAEAAAMGGWSERGQGGDGRGWGLGVARYKNKGAWLAAMAEVEVAEEVRARRLWLAVDAGTLVNPEGARSQIEGGAIQATSWTLKEEVPVRDGRVPALGWADYPILRFSEVPEVDTRFLSDPGAPPLGAGEAAQGPVAAALGNAVARALGVRIRRLPLTRERILHAAMAE